MLNMKMLKNNRPAVWRRTGRLVWNQNILRKVCPKAFVTHENDVVKCDFGGKEENGWYKFQG